MHQKYIEWKNQTQKYILYDSKYMKFKNRQSYSMAIVLGGWDVGLETRWKVQMEMLDTGGAKVTINMYQNSV